MLNKIKALFGFGSSLPATVEAPYKVEAVAPAPESVAPMPVGIEAIVATPVAEVKPKAPAKPRAPAKPKTEKTPKVAAMKVPAVKKPRAPKVK